MPLQFGKQPSEIADLHQRHPKFRGRWMRHALDYRRLYALDDRGEGFRTLHANPNVASKPPQHIAAQLSPTRSAPASELYWALFWNASM